MTKLTEDELFVRRELDKIYPQLLINAKKVTTTNFYKWGLDAISIAVEFFLNKKIEVQLKTIENGKLENFLTFIMAVQVKSSSSKFYNEFRKASNNSRELYVNYQYKGMDYEMEDSEDLDNIDKVLKCLQEATRDLDPFKKMVYDEIMAGGESYANTSKKYKINYHHLRDATEELRKELNLKCDYFGDIIDY